jgi:hypothetical protein
MMSGPEDDREGVEAVEDVEDQTARTDKEDRDEDCTKTTNRGGTMIMAGGTIRIVALTTMRKWMMGTTTTGAINASKGTGTANGDGDGRSRKARMTTTRGTTRYQ